MDDSVEYCLSDQHSDCDGTGLCDALDVLFVLGTRACVDSVSTLSASSARVRPTRRR